MSLMDEDYTGLARTIGQLRLQVEEGAPRKGRQPTVIVAGDETVKALRAQLDEARNSETKALLLLSEAKKRAHIAEEKLTGAFNRLAKYERGEARTAAGQGEVIAAYKADLSKAQEQAAEYKRHVERLEREVDSLKARNAEQAHMLAGARELEAKLRGKDQQLAELQRKLDAALERPAERVEVPVPVASECPTCAPIIRAIAQAVQASNEPQAEPESISEQKPSDALPPVRPRTHNQFTAVSGTAIGIADRIREALALADEPMTARDIGDVADVPRGKVTTNIPHLVRRGEVRRIGLPEFGVGHRYWLVSRPLPLGFNEEETTSC